MKQMIPYFVIVVLSFAAGVMEAIDNYRKPAKSPAQRRAQREDCRSKGL
jgi:hypothetical protein